MEDRKFNQETFEHFITAVLRQKAAEEGKEIFFEYGIPKNLYDVREYGEIYLDAFASEGLLGISGPVIFEYALNIKNATMQRYIKNYYRTFLNGNRKITLAFITYSSREQKIGFLEESGNNKYFNIKVFYKDTIDKWLQNYPIDFNNALLYYDRKYKLSSEIVYGFDDAEYIRQSQEKSINNCKVLKTEIESNENFALVLGAGVSIDMGALSWEKLLQSFEADLISKNIIGNSQKLTQKVGGSNLITAQVCKDLYDRNKIDFYWALHKGLYGRRKAGTSQELYEIVRIINKCINKKHFRVLTYNFDNYLEQELCIRNIKHNTLFCSESLVNNDLSIYHVHGFLPEASNKYIKAQHKKSIYLTEENYNELFNQPYIWQISSQLSFFRENICLFIGCGLTDPNIRRLLDLTKHKYKKHYAIMIKDGLNARDLKIATDHFARLNLEIIWVDKPSDIVQVLKVL